MGTGDGHRTEDDLLYHGGEWQSSDSWPPEQTNHITLYVRGDRTLSAVRPDCTDDGTTYTFDPTNPVPTIGGNTS